VDPEPLDEIKLLDEQIESAGDLEALESIFHRLNQIAASHVTDFEIQLAAGEVKQHLISRGIVLKKEAAAAPPPAVSAVTAPDGRGSAGPEPEPEPLLEDVPLTSPPPVPPGSTSSASAPRGSWKSALLFGGACGAVAALIVMVALVITAKRRAAAPAEIQIATSPPGAAVTVNGQPRCTSDCRVALAPGLYQITAVLEGYEPAVLDLRAIAGRSASLHLALTPQGQSLRILTDFESGKVALDDQAPVDLTQGQFMADGVTPGMHKVKVTGQNRESSFSFEIAGAQPPSIAGPVMARNLIALLVSSFGDHARVVTNKGPMKLLVNGQQEDDVGPAGVDLRNFHIGVNEMRVGEREDLRGIKEHFTAAPMLSVFLKSDLNIGTLIVSTGEDDVRVFLNSQEYSSKTRRGQLRIQTIGKVNVRVAKEGFDPVAPQTAEVKKGGETMVEFTLHRTPVTATLQITGSTPGAEILIDQRSVGAIGADGNFVDASVAPGDHTIDLRREQFVPKRYQRNFKAGQTISISGSDALLAGVPPPPAPKKLPDVKPKSSPAPAALKAGTIADFEESGQWRAWNGIYLHQGGGFLPYKLPPSGVFSFTVQLLKGGGFMREGKVRWRLMYLDPKNYAQFEIDNKNFVAKVITDGRSMDRTKTPIRDLEKDKGFTIQIDVTPEHIVHKLRTDSGWIPLDAWSEPGVRYSVGKFGFLVQGSDEIGLESFAFQPVQSRP
jgi:PEGA domain